MRTVYGVRIEAPAWTVDDHRRAREVVERWVEEQHPFADRGPGVSVRVDDEDPQRWWRYSIGVSLAGGDISSTVVSASTRSSSTSFEIRLAVVPGGTRIRSRPSSVSALAARELARSIVSAFVFFDAGVRVADHGRVIVDEASAQEVAAFCDAPSRALPMVIESVPSRGESVFRSERLALTLSGLAHVVTIDGDGARRAFNSFFGEDLLLHRRS